MRIHFLSARSTKAHCLTFPLRVFKQQLGLLKVETNFFYSPANNLYECDVLCIAGEAFVKNRLNAKPPDLIPFLEQSRKLHQTIIWFDTTDSSGTTWFEVLPYVDLYAKNQLLVERSLYTQSFYANRIYTDYYHRQRGVCDDPALESEKRLAIQPEQIGRLQVSWNLGLGNWLGFLRTLGARGRQLELFSPFAAYSIDPISPQSSNRTIDVSFRGRLGYPRATISYQRQETQRLLVELAKNHPLAIRYQGKLPYKRYRQELRSARIACSPYGLGEINAGRDFECFMDGAALFKPDMSHLETWPNYFEADTTYLAHRWDFSDFQDRLVEMLDAPERIQKIAQTAQDRYLDSLSETGGKLFAEHFASLLKNAIHKSPALNGIPNQAG
jgi:hypothetical protein